uniref:BCL2 interacting protein 3 n=1 Tax=Hucho hucho TaxID=62062 RepID=A0A4W5NGQ3_9TELE
MTSDLLSFICASIHSRSDLVAKACHDENTRDLSRGLFPNTYVVSLFSAVCLTPPPSPPRPQTPLLRRGSEVHSSGEKNSSQSEEDYLERRREVENLMKKNADWIWDWSSRPENIQRKEFVLKHPKRTNPLSIRNTSVMKNGGIFSAEFFKLFLPSLLISHVLAIGLGVYIGRRLTTSVTSTF